MVRGAAGALTRIGFRRDVKLFLALLVTFFVAVIAMLLLLLQTNVADTRQAVSAKEDLVADLATSELRRSLGQGLYNVDSAMLSIRSRLPVDAIVVRVGTRSVRSGDLGPNQERVTREIPGGSIAYYFDASAMHTLQTRFNLTTAITLIATVCGVLLLFLYVPRILRPYEEMLEEARGLGDAGPSDDDEASYLIQTFRDSIATLKTQEAELKRLHDIEKNRADELQTITSTLTRSLTSGFIAFGPDGRVVETNSAARDILGIGDDATGSSAAEVFGDAAAVGQLVHAVEAHEPISRQEIEIRGSAAGSKIIGLTSVPLFTPSERFLGTLALFTELTQVRRLESRVREMQSLADLGVMSAAIAHEFRNSLSTILGLLKLARRNELPKDVETKIVNAERESLELADAVTGLLQFARPMRLQLTDVDLRELIDSIVERLRDHTRASIHVEGPHVQMRGDTSLLARAFENLVRNAIDATGETAEPRIEIEIAGTPDPAVEVRDNGVGIAEKDAASLFLPFHTTKPQGTGMGLPLARKIFLLHGGTIAIAPRPEGGATVRVDLLDSFHPAEGVTISPSPENEPAARPAANQS